MRTLTATHRRNWLRFTEWKERHPVLGVRIGTGIRVATAKGSTVLGCPDGDFAELGSVREDVVEIVVLRTRYAEWANTVPLLNALTPKSEEGAFWGAIFGYAGAEAAWNNLSKVVVAVPFELIRAAWLDGTRHAQLHLLLDADLVYAGGRWQLRPTAP